ncbi:FCD domain-containing protein [Croceivirga thetidis]|uniref:FCD domain-containing protein n=1 Tax=Croceivirga thetidis TaxID=2721623 RepID=A0ABX1GQW4_9FLAO|nr:FCD domain-containing protein [Croceivirga thetidis]NKI32318.1 FCD domain-containing protein [Croceivirga thetidis]
MKTEEHVIQEKLWDYLIRELQFGNLRLDHEIKIRKVAKDIGHETSQVRKVLRKLELGGVVSFIDKELFLIPKLTEKEASELYKTVAELEVLAMDNVIITEAYIKSLKNQLLKLQRTYTLGSRINAHFEFHKLVTKNSNQILTNILEYLRTRMLFYEQYFVTDASFYDSIDNKNEGILRAVEENNMPTAALILKLKWLAILEHIIRQLKCLNGTISN